MTELGTATQQHITFKVVFLSDLKIRVLVAIVSNWLIALKSHKKKSIHVSNSFHSIIHGAQCLFVTDLVAV